MRLTCRSDFYLLFAKVCARVCRLSAKFRAAPRPSAAQPCNFETCASRPPARADRPRVHQLTPLVHAAVPDLEPSLQHVALSANEPCATVELLTSELQAQAAQISPRICA